MVKNQPVIAGDEGDLVQVLGQEDPLEEQMAIHSSIFAWRTPWIEEPPPRATVHRITKSQIPLSC